VKEKNSFALWVMAIIIILLAFVSLWQRTRMTHLGYEIQTMQTQKRQMLKVHKNLLIEFESVSALDKIEKVAIFKLSMISASPTTRVYLKDQ